MEIHDSLNNQFRLHSYVDKLNANLIQYLDNNNININYYCFFSKIIDEKHYIITSETTKHSLNGYKLITVQNAEKDNNIFEFNNNLNIIFENIHIKVTSIINNIKDVAKDLGVVITNFDNKLTDNGTIDFQSNYNKNILESDITNVMNVTSISVKILSNFENLEKLNFIWSFNQMIGINELSNSLRTLTFGFYYNQTIGINVLPNSLQTLTFGRYYNQIIGVNVLPNSLQTLTFGEYYNQIIGVNVLPNSLQTLTFGLVYNLIIVVNVLPNSLQTLTFGLAYNQVIDIHVLPNSLQTLTFSYRYNQIIGVNVLPNSLQVIYFKFYYTSEQCKNHIIPQTFQNIVKNIC
jgi:hypothetical protein